MFIFKFFFRLFFFVVKAALFLSAMVLILLVYSNLPTFGKKNEQMKFGISFSHLAAQSLKLDWQETYLKILEELKPKKIRLAAYWSEIEKTPGSYDFSYLDWQLDKAKSYDAKVVLAFGVKVPRWPECFIPEFYKEDKTYREDSLLKFEETLINRYKDRAEIEMWQVENEPFLSFGGCPDGAINGEIMDREIALTKKLDPSRKILTTDSGEIGTWLQAAKRGDVFGTTLYRIIYNEHWGYIKYPVGPNFFKLKALLIKYFAAQENIVIAELQAEPWGPKFVLDMTLNEQFRSMDKEKFKEIVSYAKETGFKEGYLWGVEWWYWLKKEKNNESLWQEAKKVL